MKWVRGCLLAAGVVVVLTLLAAAATPFGRGVLHFLFMNRHPAYHAEAMNAILELVKVQGVQPGKRLELRVETVAEPRSLRARRPEENLRGREVGNVWASREATGELTVIVETLDMGHAGRGGFAYSEKPPQKEGNLYFVGDSEYLNCTEPLKQVADRWWEVWSCYMD